MTKAPPLPEYVEINGVKTNDPVAKASHFAEYWSHLWERDAPHLEAMYQQIQELRVCGRVLHQGAIMAPIIGTMVRRACKRLKTNTALGVDLFEAGYLKQLCEEAYEAIAELLNAVEAAGGP